jgi:hypothetical protein
VLAPAVPLGGFSAASFMSGVSLVALAPVAAVGGAVLVNVLAAQEIMENPDEHNVQGNPNAIRGRGGVVTAASSVAYSASNKSKSNNPRSKNNQKQNEQARKAAKEANLSKEGQSQFHDELGELGTGDYQKVIKLAKEIAELGGKYVNK